MEENGKNCKGRKGREYPQNKLVVLSFDLWWPVANERKERRLELDLLLAQHQKGYSRPHWRRLQHSSRPPGCFLGFYGSKDPTSSVKALKKDLRIRLQSHQVHPTVLQ